MGAEREEMIQIPEAVSPEGLRARAGMMRERGDESCARHLELAADEIIKLSKDAVLVGKLRAAATRHLSKNPLEDTELEAVSYSTATLDDEKKLRFTLYKNAGQKDPLGWMIPTCEEIYDVAMHLIKNYDRLEGIE